MDDRRREILALRRSVLAERVRLIRRDLARVVEVVERINGLGDPVLANHCEALEGELDEVLPRLRIIR